MSKQEKLREFLSDEDLELSDLKAIFTKAGVSAPMKPPGAARTSRSYLVDCLMEHDAPSVIAAIEFIGFDFDEDDEGDDDEDILSMDELEAEVKVMVREAIKGDKTLSQMRKNLSETVHQINVMDIERRVAELIERHAGGLGPREIHIKQGDKVRKVEGVLPNEFDRMVQLASQRVNTLLVGPAGCGKTFVAEKIAEALDLPFSSVSCSMGMSESQLAGWLLPVGDNGKFDYVPAPFVEAYENGGVFLLDEIDAADPNVMVFLNTAIAGKHFYIPQRHENPRVEKHKDFHIMAAANTYGNGADMVYVGRNQLDGSTLDRFRAGIIQMDYSKTVEESIIHSDVLAWGRKIREGIAAHNMRRIMSTRTMKDLTTMTDACGWSRTDWEESYFADWTKDEEVRIRAHL